MGGADRNGPAPEKWISAFWTKLVEPSPTGDAERSRLSKLLNLILLVTIFLGLLIQIVYNVRWGTFKFADILAYSALGVLLLAYLINRFGYFRPASFLAIGCTVITIFVTYYLAESTGQDPSLLFYLIIPILMTEFFLELGQYVVITSLILVGVLSLQFLGREVLDTFFLLFSLTVILGMFNFSQKRFQKEQQSVLREAERKYRTLVEEIPAIIYIDSISVPGVTTYISPQVQTMLGISTEQWMTGGVETWIKHLHADDRERILVSYTRAQKNGVPFDMEYRMLGADGKEIWVRDRATVERDENGKPIFFHGVITEITDRKISEMALAASEQRYRTIFEATGVGVWQEDYSRLLEFLDKLKTEGVSDFRGFFEQHPDVVQKAAQLIEVTDANSALVRMLGARDKSEILGPIGDRFIDEQLKAFTSELIALAEGQAHYENESITRTLQGELVNEWVSINFPTNREDFKHVPVIIVNITEQKRAEKVQEVLLEVGEAVHTSDDLKVLLQSVHTSLGKLLNASNFYVALREPGKDEIYSFPYVSDQHETFAETEDLTGGLTSYVARVGKAALVDIPEHKRLIEAGQVQTLGAPSKVWIGAPLRSHGRVIGVVAMQSYDDPRTYNKSHLRPLELIADHIGLAVERKRAQEALRDSQEKLEAFFSQSLDGFFFMALDKPISWNETVDKENVLDYVFEHERVTKVNEAMLAQYGIEAADILGKTPRDTFAHDLEQGRKVWRNLFDAGHFHVETDERKADGTQMWIEGDYVCLYDDEGRITGHFGIQREVTYRKRAEASLRESEERYRKLIELSPEVIWISHDHTIVYANRACLELLGATSISQVIGRSTLDIIHPDYHAEIQARAKYMQETGEAVPALEEQLIRLDGTVVDVEVTAAPIPYGDITAIQVFARDISVRKKAENAIRASEERFRNIFEFSGIPIWVEDFTDVMKEIEKLRQQGVTDLRAYVEEHPEFIPHVTGQIRVVDVNSAVLKLLEVDNKESLLGPLSKVFSYDVLANFREEIFAIAEGKTYFEGETYSVTAGRKRRDEWVIASIPDRKNSLDRVLVTVLDISDRKQREREMQTLAAVSSALRHAQTRVEMLPVILDQLLVLLHATGTAIAMRDLMAGNGRIEAARGTWKDFVDMIIPSNIRVFGQVVETGQPLVTDDLSGLIADEAPEYGEAITAGGVNCMAAIPLLANEENIGVIYIGRREPFTPLEIGILTSIADMSANAIQRVTAHELALRRAEQLAIVNEIGRALAETLDIEQIYEQLHRAAFHLLPNSHALFISMHEAERRLISYVFGLERDQRLSQAQLSSLPWQSSDEKRQRQVAQSGQPVIVNDLADGPGIVPPRGEADTGEPAMRSALFVPMIAHNNVIGVLQVQSHMTARYTEADAELLSVVANTAAAAIENARLFDEVNHRIDQLQALHDIDSAISSSHDLRITLDILLSNTLSLLGVDAADVLQLNAFTYNLEYTAGQGFRTPFGEIERLPFEEGFAGRVASQRNTLILTDPLREQSSPTFARFIRAEGFVNYVGMPLIAKGMLIGILEIYHRTSLPMNAYWLDLLKALAGQAALAIDNTELFMRLQESNTQLVMAYDATIEGWSRALDLRDKETEGHTRRVTELTLELARSMQIPESELIHIRRGALLHDIGKMGVPDPILLKTGKLTGEEWQIMRRHPQYAFDLLSPIRYLQQSLDIPYSHHEHWDGNGYPRGLKGELIPLAARLFAIVDVWDALRSDRPYRPAWPEEQVIEYIKGLSGKQFDPRVVDAFLNMMKK